MIIPPISERLITIHSGIQIVPDDVSDRLLDRQIEAMTWIDENPFAKAMNVKVRRYFRDNVVPL